MKVGTISKFISMVAFNNLGFTSLKRHKTFQLQSYVRQAYIKCLWVKWNCFPYHTHSFTCMYRYFICLHSFPQILKVKWIQTRPSLRKLVGFSHSQIYTYGEGTRSLIELGLTFAEFLSGPMAGSSLLLPAAILVEEMRSPRAEATSLTALMRRTWPSGSSPPAIVWPFNRWWHKCAKIKTIKTIQSFYQK